MPKGLVKVLETDDEKALSDSIFLLESRTHYGDWLYDESIGAFLSETMKEFGKASSFDDYWAVPDPILVRCDFYVGYWCGKDKDLICVQPLPYLQTKELDPYLSPDGKTPREAVRLALKKIESIKNNNLVSHEALGGKG